MFHSSRRLPGAGIKANILEDLCGANNRDQALSHRPTDLRALRAYNPLPEY
jgi:hypothetical protein